MADVQMIFGILLFLGIAFPGMLTAWWLLFPNTVAHAQKRVDATPWKSFFMGIGILIILAIPVSILLSAGGGVGQFLGWLLIAATLAVGGIGAAGVAAKMGKSLANRSEKISPAAGFVIGAIALELAAVFPFVGWFIVMPLAIVTSLGATVFALLGLQPRQKTIQTEAAEASPA